MPAPSRRSFLRAVASASALPAIAQADEPTVLQPREAPPAPTGPNDRVRIATIGMGIIGFIDTETALKVPGVEFVAAADVYEGRRARAREVYGKDLAVTADYREILDRDDVDAVLICVPDHWHARMAIDAMKAGKAVYCEKPMVRTVDEGPGVIAAQKETGAVFQVGSQYASSILYDKVRDLIGGGAIGAVNCVEARYNRNSAIGAWQYSIPLDASAETVDWDRFLGSAPKVPFDAVRAFRWRNYSDYGTAVAGDLYVHLFTGIHHALDAIGPNKIAAAGGIRHWKDGRDVPDVILGLFDYTETEGHGSFSLALQANFVDGGGPNNLFRFVGSEGVIEVSFRELTLRQVGIAEPTADAVLKGYNSVRTFSEAQQEAYAEKWLAEHPRTAAKPTASEPEKFVVPDGYDERLDHFAAFFHSVRTKAPVYEDAVFGLRAAAPALLANASYYENRMIGWDPVAMKVTS